MIAKFNLAAEEGVPKHSLRTSHSYSKGTPKTMKIFAFGGFKFPLP
jgi:hypothetical protein